MQNVRKQAFRKTVSRCGNYRRPFCVLLDLMRNIYLIIYEIKYLRLTIDKHWTGLFKIRFSNFIVYNYKVDSKGGFSFSCLSPLPLYPSPLRSLPSPLTSLPPHPCPLYPSPLSPAPVTHSPFSPSPSPPPPTRSPQV